MKNIYWIWVLFLTVPFCKNVQAKFIETCDGPKSTPTRPPVPAGSPTSTEPPPTQTQPPEKKPATSV